MNFQEITQLAIALLTTVGLKVVGAILLLFIGLRLIEFSIRLLRRAFRNQQIEPTIISYLLNIISVTLRIVLIVAILGFFGIETTSFAALLAAVGIAIGAAWGGLLANFAAGAFLIIFRPFQVGDFITAGGVTGTVVEIGLFTTTLNTPDNVMTIVANNKIFADNIQNYSVNSYRRVDLLAQLAHDVNYTELIALLKVKIRQIPNVIDNPAPDVEILNFNLAGPVLAVRPYCHNEHYWQVYFDTNKAIMETFSEMGYSLAKQLYTMNRSSLDGAGSLISAPSEIG